MSGEQCMERAELCFSMAQNHRSVTQRRENMLRASWLWLFVRVGMFT